MKTRERPILFSTEMVRAILDERKTQTRRVIKPQPSTRVTDVLPADPAPSYWAFDGTKPVQAIACPYGQPGDELWVRETWNAQNDRGRWWHETPRDFRDQYNWAVVDKATFEVDEMPEPPRWVSPIFMPRWASRITLRVVDVRVERVQGVSEDDAIAEGVEPTTVDSGGFTPWGESIEIEDYRESFADLWDNINATRGFPWESNPWVWVVEFEASA